MLTQAREVVDAATAATSSNDVNPISLNTTENKEDKTIKIKNSNQQSPTANAVEESKSTSLATVYQYQHINADMTNLTKMTQAALAGDLPDELVASSPHPAPENEDEVVDQQIIASSSSSEDRYSMEYE